MSDWLALLERKASEIVPGAEYNDFRSALEERGEAPDLFYEIFLAEKSAWEKLRDAVYPQFARYLKSKSINPEKAGGVAVSVFVGDRCLILEGGAFLDVFKGVEGLSADAFHSLVLSWLAHA